MFEKYQRRKLMQLIFDCHVHSMDMFPYDGMDPIGRTLFYCKPLFLGRIAAKLKEVLSRSKAANLSKGGFESLQMIVATAVSVLGKMEAAGKVNDQPAAEHHARLFYILIGCAWTTLKPYATGITKPIPHSTLSPFEGMVRTSGFDHLWHGKSHEDAVLALIELAKL